MSIGSQFSRYPSVVAALFSGLLVCPLEASAQDSWADGVLDLSNLDGTNGFVINGGALRDRMGESVASAGDINGDGFDDLIIGASRADNSLLNQPDAGNAYLVFGGPSLGATGSLSVSSLNGTNGIVYVGNDADDYAGITVSGAGDINNDGIDDLIIGATGSDLKGFFSVGEAYVIYGSRSLGTATPRLLTTPAPGEGFIIAGVDAGDALGGTVSGAGDFNNDGIDDLLVGAQGVGFNGLGGAGAAYLIYGGTNIPTSTTTGPTFDVTTINGVNGFELRGNVNGHRVGSSVSAIGDFNGDGIDDVLIGGLGGRTKSTNWGEAYILFGSATSPANSNGTLLARNLDGSDGFTMTAIQTDDNLWRTAAAGDVNNDGYADVIIGAWGADPNSNNEAGETYVVFGGPTVGSTGTLPLSSLNGSNGFVINGIDAEDQSGWSVASAGDVNGDGIADLIIGAQNADPDGRSAAGEAYVIFGRSSLGSSGSIELSSLNGSNGFVLKGVNVDDNAGYSVSSAGDINGDGFDDVILGAPVGKFLNDPDPGTGKSYVVFGNVPEPGSLAVLGMGSLALLRRRR